MPRRCENTLQFLYLIYSCVYAVGSQNDSCWNRSTSFPAECQPGLSSRAKSSSLGRARHACRCSNSVAAGVGAAAPIAPAGTPVAAAPTALPASASVSAPACAPPGASATDTPACTPAVASVHADSGRASGRSSAQSGGLCEWPRGTLQMTRRGGSGGGVPGQVRVRVRVRVSLALTLARRQRRRRRATADEANEQRLPRLAVRRAR